ncbi:MAG: efflux RND transporter periplasmic adaptor subunit [Nitrospinae bacterium]|nr:efflux RND transporter periplasmic adaptor subunit [Nitrospinota bacterium]
MNLRRLLLNKFTLIVAVAALGGGGYAAWKKSRVEPPEKKYKFQKVTRGEVTQSVSANGTLNPVVLVQVGTQVSGTVIKWYKDFNDRVQKDDVLLSLDPALFKAQVAQDKATLHSAEAAFALAKANESRIRALLAEKYETQADLDTATAALESAKAAIELAKAQLEKDTINLNYSVIRSPVSGVVVSRQIDVGQTVAASFNTPTLFTIAQDLHKMQIDTSYAEADIGGIKVGQTVKFSVDAFQNRTYSGRVRQLRINPTTQSNVVTYDVVVDVNNEDETLLPGMTAYCNIAVANKTSVLLAPNAALRFKPPAPKGQKPAADHGKPAGAPAGAAAEKEDRRNFGKGTVYVLEQGNFRQIKVGLGITDNKMTEIVSGDLKEGDQIVVEELLSAESSRPSTFQMRMF